MGDIVKKFEKLEQKFLNEIKASRCRGSSEIHIDGIENIGDNVGVEPEYTISTDDKDKFVSIDHVLGSAKTLTRNLRQNDAISESNLRNLEEKVIQLEEALQERMKLQILRKKKNGTFLLQPSGQSSISTSSAHTPAKIKNPTTNEQADVSRLIGPSTCSFSSAKKNVDVIYKNEVTGKTFIVKCQPCPDVDRSKEPRLEIRVYRVVDEDGLIKIKLLKDGKRVVITPKCQERENELKG